MTVGVALFETTDPAGVLDQRGSDLWFRYGDQYLTRPNAISLYGPDLPLGHQWYSPVADLGMPGVIRDAIPQG